MLCFLHLQNKSCPGNPSRRLHQQLAEKERSVTELGLIPRSGRRHIFSVTAAHKMWSQKWGCVSRQTGPMRQDTADEDSSSKVCPSEDTQGQLPSVSGLRLSAVRYTGSQNQRGLQLPALENIEHLSTGLL